MELETTLKIIAGGIVLIGLIVAFSLSLRRKYRDDTAAKNYERIRNKLTTREKKVEKIEEEDEEYSGGVGGGIIGSLIGGFIVIMIGVSLLGPVTNSVNDAVNSSNQSMSPVSQTFLKAVPIIFIVAIVFIAIASAANALRNGGMI